MIVLLLAGGSLPVMAQGVGAIGGTVTDSSGGVLPGVTVTLNNAQGTVGGRQVTTTDERGAYQFPRLVPGTYSVKGELQGFRPTEQRELIVNADITARADLKLEIGALSEGVTVSGEAPLLDTSNALKQTTLSREVLNAMPNRFDVWSVAKVIPSVALSKVDVGGSEAFLQSSVTVHGSSNEGAISSTVWTSANWMGQAQGRRCTSIPTPFRRTTSRLAARGLRRRTVAGCW